MSQFDQKFLNSDLDIKDEWETPRWLRAIVGVPFGGFTVDAAANAENATCSTFWSIKDDGIEQDWKGHRVFCNPPYTGGRYGPWIAKATDEYITNGVTTVMILPMKLVTQAFADVWKFAHYLIVPYRRIKFYPPKDHELDPKDSAPTFDSCIVIWCTHDLSFDHLKRLSRAGRVIDLHTGLFRV